MFSYLMKKLERRKTKKIFKEYGSEIREYSLPDEGNVFFAHWLNPFESPKTITQSYVNFFKKFTTKGDFVIDIGAHTGDTTVPLALAVGKEGRVLALDPNPVVFKILEENAKLNKDKTHIIPLCAAAAKDNAEYYYNSSEATFNNGGISKSIKNKHGKYSLGKTVSGIHLEQYLNDNYKSILQKLSFIKIDTEGHDYDILLSLTNIISDERPVIIAECFKKMKKSRRFELYNFLADNSYDLYYINDFSENVVFKKIAKIDMMNWKHFDFCAIPQEKPLKN